MNRRTFITKLFTGFISIASMNHLMRRETWAVGNEAMEDKLHYIPLNGRSLKEIALRKEHHGKDRFISPLSSARRGRLLKVLSWKFFHENRLKTYYDGEQVSPVSVDWKLIREHQGVSVTFLKHASVLIKDHDSYILLDPVFDDVFWFIKDFTPLLFDLNEMPKPHHVLLSHGHYDHLDKPSLAYISRHSHFISPLGYDDIFSDLGIRNRTQLDWYDTHHDGMREITFLPSNHWTMRNPVIGPNTSLWGSYLIRTTSGYTIYLSADTAYFDGFEQLGKDYDIDLAVINLGAYEPRWFMASSHINPEETVRAFRELNAKKLMVIHWGTFRLGDEPVHFPPMQLKQALKKEGLLDRFVDFRHGQTYLCSPEEVIVS